MTKSEQVARIRIALRDIEPAIWRRVEVPVGMNLRGLHGVIQAVFGWQDYHLFEFQIGDRRYGIPSPEWGDERKVFHARSQKVGMLIERGVREIDYTYDFGDNWQHSVMIEGVDDGDSTLEYPRLVDGARRGPPEDVGGAPGFFEFVEAMANRRHPEHRRMLEWYGGQYDPREMDLDTIGHRLGEIVERRKSGIAGYAKSKRVG